MVKTLYVNNVVCDTHSCELNINYAVTQTGMDKGYSVLKRGDRTWAVSACIMGELPVGVIDKSVVDVRYRIDESKDYYVYDYSGKAITHIVSQLYGNAVEEMTTYLVFVGIDDIQGTEERKPSRVVVVVDCGEHGYNVATTELRRDDVERLRRIVFAIRSKSPRHRWSVRWQKFSGEQPQTYMYSGLMSRSDHEWFDKIIPFEWFISYKITSIFVVDADEELL